MDMDIDVDVDVDVDIDTDTDTDTDTDIDIDIDIDSDLPLHRVQYLGFFIYGIYVTKQIRKFLASCPSCFTSSLCSSLKHFTSVACAKRSPTQAPRWSQGLQEDSQPVSIF